METKEILTLDEALAGWREAELLAQMAAAAGYKREAALARKQAREWAMEIARIVDVQSGEKA